MPDECKTMVHGVRPMLDLHSEWVVLKVDIQNTFNSIFQTTIFQELRSCIGTLDYIFPFVHWFYTCPPPTYF
jgi:hypothetical protein